MNPSDNKGAKKKTKKLAEKDLQKAVVVADTFAKFTQGGSNKPRLKMEGLSKVVESIRQPAYSINTDLPKGLFYEISGATDGVNITAILTPVTKITGALKEDSSSNSSKDSTARVEISSTAVLPSIGRPYGHLGIKEVDDEQSSSTDAPLFEDSDNTDNGLNAEAQSLGFNPEDSELPAMWSYDCMTDDEGVTIESLIAGFNLFLYQIKMSKNLVLEKVGIQGNRLQGFVSTEQDSSSTTLWGSAKSHATVTEVSPNVVEEALSCSSHYKGNIFQRQDTVIQTDNQSEDPITIPDPSLEK